MFCNEGARYFWETSTPRAANAPQRNSGRPAATRPSSSLTLRMNRIGLTQWLPPCRLTASSTCWSTTPEPVPDPQSKRLPKRPGTARATCTRKARSWAPSTPSPKCSRKAAAPIINISSIYGIVGSPTSTAYHAAKGAIRLFTKSAALQYAADNIRINSIHPGYCHTPLTTRSYDNERHFAWIQERIPIGRATP
ncbi:Cyclopentanol dehydrogenase [Geodia barretti]|uniref:Cyclopentanol dehydrogenase n=1 Tax=Geodia barretti TaxID=519541 RepID=A0AA35R7X2_GEOBA|nr:Cyclopentanol dehydrogenase [Geodia barretti]